MLFRRPDLPPLENLGIGGESPAESLGVMGVNNGEGRFFVSYIFTTKSEYLRFSFFSVRANNPQCGDAEMRSCSDRS